jgi:hypothetical protein
MEDFVEYVLSFYGTGWAAIYDYAFTREEVEAALAIRLENTEIEFAADSYDRELVRDIVLDVLRGEK